MKVSVSSYSYRAWFKDGRIDLLRFVDEVKRLGGDGLEVFHDHLDAADMGGHLKRVADKAASLGLDISSVIAANDFSLPTAAARAEQVEKMKRWIAWAADAGITRVNTFTGFHRSGQDPGMEAARVIDSYREVVPVAEQRGVALCLENHSGVCRDADGLLWIIRAVGGPAMRTNPDPTNFVDEFPVRSERSREAIYTETAKIMPLAANLHLKTGDFNARGDDPHYDVARLMKLIKDSGYDGHVVLELYSGEPDVVCAKGVAMVRRHL